LYSSLAHHYRAYGTWSHIAPMALHSSTCGPHSQFIVLAAH